jgi:hypothetical protein
MQNYIKTYLNYFDLGEQDIITCEGCMKEGRVDGEGFDIHHIHGRGEGKDTISNLACLCRHCHDRATTSKNYVSPSEMQLIHNYFLAGMRKVFLI